MAEREDLQKQYAYANMSNKVEQADRRGRYRDAGTGVVEALRAGAGRMGDQIQRSANANTSSLNKLKAKRKTDEIELAGSRRKKPKPFSTSATTILELGDLSGYQPSTEASQLAYESLLTLLGRKELLGDQGSSVIRDAAQEVIPTLRDEQIQNPEKHALLSQLLRGKGANEPGGLSTQIFTTLAQLGKAFDDYGKKSSSADQTTTPPDEMDDAMGVAVVFDDDGDDDDNGDGDGNKNKNNKEKNGINDDDDDNAGLQAVIADSSSEDEDDEQASVSSQANNRNHDNDNVDAADDDDHENVLLQQDKKKSTEARTLRVHEIDAHFLQRQLSKHIPDAAESANMATQILPILREHLDDPRQCENQLLVRIGFDGFATMQLILHNRLKIWAAVSYKRAATDAQRQTIQEQLQQSKAGRAVWDELQDTTGNIQDWATTTRDRLNQADNLKGGNNNDNDDDDNNNMQVEKETTTDLDLDALVLPEGAHTMSNETCNLPDTSWRATKKGYEEVHVPAVQSVIPKGETLIPIAEMPAWTHNGFKGMDKLNRVQSKLYDVALKTSENVLLCAPTGAGKTNVACLTMMNILGQYREEHTDADGNTKDSYDLSAFKIVYVAPMKALVQEVVQNFAKRLADYGVTVRELSGDSSLSRQEISETQILVTTPEKWDVVTRQGEGRAFTQLVKLVIIDEIHLLHDDRGPVLESIVARIMRQVETNAEPVRLVGLSATLPNYTDVAAFLRVDPNKGLFFFDHSFRPVPLQMQYIGLTERNAFKRFQLQNEICYEKVMDQRKNGQQILIFVHSRAETGKTAKALRDLAAERDEGTFFVQPGKASQEVLLEEQELAKNADLKDVLSHGFGIHHAGMARADRAAVEDLFADRHIAVLVTTATLAWGVNLPAHAVIIKGTQVYNPAKGCWAELSPLDILQMLGRAGRPQYDSEGEGIILTEHSKLQYYLSLTNLQLPVESQLIKTLADHMNAEIVLGTIQSVDEAAAWLSYTFLYVRMLQNPTLYGIEPDAAQSDPTLWRRRRDLAHSAALVLEKSHLVRYDRQSGNLYSTPLGRISSQFYISHSSMSVYTRHMRPNMSDIELLRLFSLSGEFAHITVREEEKLELQKLSNRVPIPVKESPTEPSAKVNILLQAYISRLKLEGFALVADMAFIQQSAARIMRALFEIALRRKWASLAKLCLDLSNMVSYKIWRSQSPLRQFRNVPEVVSRKLERKSDIEWARYTDLTASDLGELVGVPKMGRVLHKLVQQFPRLELSAQIQPISRSLIRIELSILPSFQFDIDVHGFVQLFHVIIEDVNGEFILHHETFSLKSKAAEEEQMLVFSVPILDPLPPAYFIRLISDRWLHSTASLPVSFNKMILPSRFPPPTELLDLQPLLPSSLGEASLAKLFPFKEFNLIQTQTFHELFKTDKNCLVCSPPGSGKLTCGLFAVLRLFSTNANGKCVYVAPTDDVADHTFSEWTRILGKLLPAGALVRLSGETAPDLSRLNSGKLVISSAKQWDMLSRRWRQRKAVQKVALIIFDDLHFLGGEVGPIMEVVISRTRYMSSQLDTDHTIRIVGLGASIANARDVGDWIGATSKSLFNFSPKARPMPLEIFFQAFEESNHATRLMAMAKPVYNAVTRHIGNGSAIIYVPSRRQAQLTSIDLMTYHENQESDAFLGRTSSSSKISELVKHLREPAQQLVAASGICFVHSGMTSADLNTVLQLYNEGTTRVLVCPVDMCWKVQVVANLVLIMGTDCFDGREGRHVDYPIVDLLHMMGRNDPKSNGKCVVMCHAPKKDYLKKLLYEPIPIESHLDALLHDPLNAEIVTKSVSSMQDAIDYLTWSFLYRRLAKNPTYYGLQGTSNTFISEHLSEMVETCIGDLEESKCCKVSDEGDLSPLNLGMIAAYYNVQYRTIELVASSVTPKTKIRGIVEILAASWEFSFLPIRHGENKTMRSLARVLPQSLPNDAAYDSNTKALILLQSHFSRKGLSPDMLTDQRLVVREGVNLVQAIVDVISSTGWLKPALAAMEVSQMLVQGLWNKDHVLKQIPHFSDQIIKRCVEYKGDEPIDSVFDILTLDDDVRNQLLQLDNEKMADVAVFCNNYPSVEVSFSVTDPDDITTGDPVQVVIKLQREVDDDIDEEEISNLGVVAAPLFPTEKKEGWWVVVGDTTTNMLYSLKRVSLLQDQEVKLEFLAPEEAGDYDLTVFCMSDSYLGCDQEYKMPISVAVSDSDSSSSEEE